MEALNAVELEQLSERGQAFRHELSCSVLALLSIADAWWCEAEFDRGILSRCALHRKARFCTLLSGTYPALYRSITIGS